MVYNPLYNFALNIILSNYINSTFIIDPLNMVKRLARDGLLKPIAQGKCNVNALLKYKQQNLSKYRARDQYDMTLTCRGRNVILRINIPVHPDISLSRPPISQFSAKTLIYRIPHLTNVQFCGHETVIYELSSAIELKAMHCTISYVNQ